jgi:hypothetical protein
MKFVHPEILWALAALSIPVIVHLFNFRKFKKVLFPNVEFLKEIKQETQSKSKLKHLLILLSRMFALACIILAFAQPFVPGAIQKKEGERAISIYIDNSFSMQAEGSEGRLLDVAKNKAIEFVTGLAPSDKVQILTADFEGRHQRAVSKDEALALIQEIQPSASTHNLSEIVARQQDALHRSGAEQLSAFVFSDFQKKNSDFKSVKQDSTIMFRLYPEESKNGSNVYIDSVWFDSPLRMLNQPDLLHIRIGCAGIEHKPSVTIRLTINGQIKSVTTTEVKAGMTTETSIAFTNTEPGLKQASVSVDDYPVVYDNAWYFSFDVAQQIKIAEIVSRDFEIIPDPVQSVFTGDPFFAMTQFSEGNIDYQRLRGMNMVILSQLEMIPSGLGEELIKIMKDGGAVVVFPSEKMDVGSYNRWLQSMNCGGYNGWISKEAVVDRVNEDHELYKGVFEKKDGIIEYPKATAIEQITMPTNGVGEPLMTFRDGSPMLVNASVGRGRLILSAVTLEASQSNFIRHAFFPATLIRVAEFSQPVYPLAHILGSRSGIQIRAQAIGGDATYKLKSAEDSTEIIPEHRNAEGGIEIFPPSELTNAGNYFLLSGNSTLAGISFNYNRNESDAEKMNASELLEAINAEGWQNWGVLESDAQTLLSSQDQLDDSKKYWYSMIVWSLIFLAIEILLIKFWKR